MSDERHELELMWEQIWDELQQSILILSLDEDDRILIASLGAEVRSNLTYFISAPEVEVDSIQFDRVDLLMASVGVLLRALNAPMRRRKESYRAFPHYFGVLLLGFALAVFENAFEDKSQRRMESSKQALLMFLDERLTEANIDGRNSLVRDLSISLDEFHNVVPATDTNQLLVAAIDEANQLIYEQHREQIEVSINIPQEDIPFGVVDSLHEAVDAFMEAAGYEYDAEDEPVHGSFFQELRFKARKILSTEEVQEAFETGKEALRARTLHKPTAEATNEYSQAAAQLLSALSDVDEAVVQIGPLLILKMQIQGKPKVFIKTVTPEMGRQLDENPEILADPSKTFALLQELGAEPDVNPDETLTTGLSELPAVEGASTTALPEPTADPSEAVVPSDPESPLPA